MSVRVTMGSRVTHGRQLLATLDGPCASLPATLYVAAALQPLSACRPQVVEQSAVRIGAQPRTAVALGGWGCQLAQGDPAFPQRLREHSSPVRGLPNAPPSRRAAQWPPPKERPTWFHTGNDAAWCSSGHC